MSSKKPFKKDVILIELITLLGIEENYQSPKQNVYHDLGFDSLDATEAAMAIEEQYNIEIPDEKADQLFIRGTLGDLADYIRNHLNGMARALTPA